MAAIAGIVRFDNRPCAQDVVRLLVDGIAAAGRTSPEICHSTHVTMVAAPLADEASPAIACSGVHADRPLFVWDGRLDNRVDLLVRYGECRGASATDSEVILDYLLRRGPAGFADVVGDWSAALWLPQDRSLYLASDYLGIRPLHYRTIPGGLAWASSIEALLRLGDDELDRDYLLGFLTYNPPPTATAYRSIRSVPAGHSLRISASGQITSEKHWDISHIRIQRARADAFDDELRWHLTEAVRVRLTSPAPTWISLSGGFDSSSIFCLAHRLVAASIVPTPRLRAASRVSKASPESDESRFVEAVVDGTPWPAILLDVDQDGKLQYTRDTPSVCSDFLHQCATRMAAEGATSLHSGLLGDMVMGQYVDTSPFLATRLHERRLISFVQDAHRCARATRDTIWEVLSRALLASRSAKYQHQRELTRRAIPGTTARPTPDNLARFFCLPAALGQRAIEFFPNLPALASDWPDPGQRHMLRELHYTRVWRLLESPEAVPWIRMSYPFGHRPLLEFALGLPPAVLCPPGAPRAAMKRALATVLPERILRRFTKGYAEPRLRRGFMKQAIELQRKVGDLRLAALGLIEPTELSRQLSDFLAGSVIQWQHLQRIAITEEWLAFLESASTHTPPRLRGETARDVIELHSH